MTSRQFEKLLDDKINVQKHQSIRLVSPTGNQKHVHFQVAGKRYQGLTKAIEKYWGKPYVPEELKKSTSRYAKQPKTGLRCKSSDAMTHGKIVDEEIERITKLGGTEFVKKYCKGKETNMDRCTHMLLRFLRKKRWKPVAAQFPIFSSECRIATAIDLLCRIEDGSRRLVLVELKATLNQDDTVYRHADRRMAPPLESVRNSYENHHQLQLALMRRILEQDYGVVPDKALVLRVCATSITRYNLSDWASDPALSQRVVDFLAAQESCNNNKKKKRVRKT